MIEILEQLGKEAWKNKDEINIGLDLIVKSTSIGSFIKSLITNKKQEEIYKDISKEIKKSKNKLELLDEDILSELFVILENSIKKEDILARYYIQIIGDLSNIDYLVFKKINQIKIKTTTKVLNPIKKEYYMEIPVNFDELFYFREIKNILNEKIPYELIKKSIRQLINLELISNDKREISKNNSLYTGLGRSLYNISNKV